MKIVIAGVGSVGELLADELSETINDLTMIDINRKTLERLVKKDDLDGVIGNCVSQKILFEAGVDQCDVYIAATSSDEQNIISSLIAKKLGAKHTIVRVEDPNYAAQLSFLQEELGMTAMINSQFEAALAIYESLRYPWAVSIETFTGSQLKIVEFFIQEANVLVGQKVSHIHTFQENVAVCAIIRDDETLIPSGQEIIQKNDYIFVIGQNQELMVLKDKLHIDSKKIRSTFIIGGGGISDYLIEQLIAANIAVKVIEKNHQTAKYLSEKYPKCVVIEGDGSDPDLLQEERVDKYDAFIALTGIDEENIISSLSVLKKNANKKVVTKVGRIDLLKILGDDRLQTIITPKTLVANKIIQFLRSKTGDGSSHFETYFRMAGNQAEAIEFVVNDHSKIIGPSLRELNIEDHVMLAYILRGKDLIIPRGKDVIKAQDRVIIVTTNKNYDDIDDILR